MNSSISFTVQPITLQILSILSNETYRFRFRRVMMLAENPASFMIEIHKELLTLQTQANELMKTISENFEGMGL